MKKLILKFRILKNRFLNWQIYRHYHFDKDLFYHKITLEDLKNIDPNFVPRSTFSLEHHLIKLF